MKKILSVFFLCACFSLFGEGKYDKFLGKYREDFSVGSVNGDTFTMKGEIIVGAGAGSFTAYAPGTNGFVLTADSSTSEGVIWRTGLTVPGGANGDIQYNNVGAFGGWTNLPIGSMPTGGNWNMTSNLDISGPSTGGYTTGLHIDYDDSTYGPTLAGHTDRDGDERIFFRGALISADNQTYQFGSFANYRMGHYTDNKFKFKSGDIDGAGTIGDIFTVDDGTPDVNFYGQITSAGLNVDTGGTTSTIEGTVSPVLKIDYSDSGTDTVQEAFMLRHVTDSDMADDFGVSQTFAITDDVGIINRIASIEAFRDGADTDGELVISTLDGADEGVFRFNRTYQSNNLYLGDSSISGDDGYIRHGYDGTTNLKLGYRKLILTAGNYRALSADILGITLGNPTAGYGRDITFVSGTDEVGKYDAGDDEWTFSSNVGIGRTPTERLDVYESSDTARILVETGMINGYAVCKYKTPSHEMGINLSDSSGEFYVYDYDTTTKRFKIENDGTLSTDTVNYETLVTDDNDIPNKEFIDLRIKLEGAGDYTVLLGESGNASITGDYNIIGGYLAGTSITTGASNTLFGQRAGYSLTATNDNVAIGDFSQRYMMGIGNIAIGLNTMTGSATPANNTGGHNVAIGSEALTSLTSGDANFCIGERAGNEITTGGSNVYIGAAAGRYNTTGSGNTGIGASACRGMRGSTNVAIGNSALIGSGVPANNTGGDNVALGVNTGSMMTSGNMNFMAVSEAGQNLSSGGYNVLIGQRAGQDITTASSNVMIGRFAGRNVTGGDNTMLGTNTGQGIGIDRCVFVGYGAGYYETADDKFFVDNQIRTNEATARTDSIIYGVMNATRANQTLALNANVKIAENVGFYDTTPVAQATALTASNASTVDVTYGTEERDVINNLRIRVDELEAKLQAYGLLQ